jgi:antitoxin (DNA-binding transcriptional repressor) of toxin-antitoxin stability system
MSLLARGLSEEAVYVRQTPPPGRARLCPPAALRYGPPMPREISIRELRTGMDAVVAAIRAGDRRTLTVDGEPVADIVPHGERRSPWVPACELRRIRRETPADACLLADLLEVRGSLVVGQ